MKKIVLIIVIAMIGWGSYAQVIIEPTYVLNGDLIEATLYHNNGGVAQVGYYTSENKLQGEWISFDAEGNKTAVAYYDKGNKIGTWTFYQGDIIKRVRYEDAKISEVTTLKVLQTHVVTN